MTKLLANIQRRWKFRHVGKGSSNTAWVGVGRRDTIQEYVLSKTLEDERKWNTQPLTKKMQRLILKHRMQDTPSVQRIATKDWIVKEGEIVEVTDGLDKGRRGLILEIFHAGMVMKVEGVRLEKLEGLDPSSGERVTQFKEDWVRYSEVLPIDPSVDEPCEVEFMKLENSATGKLARTRVSKLTGSVIPDPAPVGLYSDCLCCK